MQITRRDFIKIAGTTAAAMGISQIALEKFTEQLAMAGPTAPKVLWLQGQCCTGCSTSFVGLMNRVPIGGNPAHMAVATAETWSVEGGGVPSGGNTIDVYGDPFDPDTSGIDDVLLDVIDLKYHPTLMSAGGQLAVNVLDSYCVPPVPPATNDFVLVIEGSIPFTADGAVGKEACSIGNNDGSVTNINARGNITLYDALDKLVASTNVAAVIACGTCAAFGGIPNGENSKYDGSSFKSSGAASVTTVMKNTLGYTGPIVNVSGCPINPDWLYLTVAQYLAGASVLVNSLDSNGRPGRFASGPLAGVELYYRPVHSGNCINIQAFYDGVYATKLGDPNKCLAMLGCRGPATFSSCSSRNGGDLAELRSQNPAWNDISGAVSSSEKRSGACINAGAPCIGCTEKNFPDGFSPFINY